MQAVQTSPPISSPATPSPSDKGKVLVVEDDPETAEEIARALVSAGFDVEHEADGEAALRRLARGGVDLVTLDRMLPGRDGLGVLQALRQRGSHAPVLMVSALSDVDDRITGLRAGGDDYLVKPFAPGELIARAEVLLRRRSAQAETALRVADLELDLIRHVAHRRGAAISLLPMEFKLLEFLMRNAGQILSRRLIFEAVWGYYFDPGTNLIDVHFGKLRRKIDGPDCTPLFITERGVGYMLHAG